MKKTLLLVLCCLLILLSACGKTLPPETSKEPPAPPQSFTADELVENYNDVIAKQVILTGIVKDVSKDFKEIKIARTGTVLTITCEIMQSAINESVKKDDLIKLTGTVREEKYKLSLCDSIEILGNDPITIEFEKTDDIEMTTRDDSKIVFLMLNPKTASIENIEWISDDPEIVKFEKYDNKKSDTPCGSIKGLKAGITTVYVKCNDVVSSKIKVTVTQWVSTSIDLTKFNNIKTGMTYQQVRDLIGEDGTLSNETELSGYSGKIYTWKQGQWVNSIWMESAGIASFLFQNDKLVTKSQIGLK